MHTGLLGAADNEAQVAGVLAHEISHVALRHGTNQASKANLLQLPAMLAGGLLGSRGSMLGQLGQLGIGLGANSVLLKFRAMPNGMPIFWVPASWPRRDTTPSRWRAFSKNWKRRAARGGPQFLSDHPNPGNRVKAVEEEIRYLPRASYATGQCH